MRLFRVTRPRLGAMRHAVVGSGKPHASTSTDDSVDTEHRPAA